MKKKIINLDPIVKKYGIIILSITSIVMDLIFTGKMNTYILLWLLISFSLLTYSK